MRVKESVFFCFLISFCRGRTDTSPSLLDEEDVQTFLGMRSPKTQTLQALKSTHSLHGTKKEVKKICMEKKQHLRVF